MSITINLICFDINYSDNKLEINEENFFKLYYNNNDFPSPLTLIKNFLYDNKKAQIQKVKKTSSKIEIEFLFQVNEKKKVFYNIIILHDFTRIYNICLASDGYLIFFSSENQIYKKKLDNIIEYIKESCDVETKAYIINVYKDKCLENNEINSINQYLENKKIIYYFYQIHNDDGDGNNNEIKWEEKINENEESSITFEELIKKSYIEKTRRFSGVSLYYDPKSGSGKSKCLIY